MIRSIGKTFYAYAYTWSGARRLLTRHARTHLPFIVCYHRVVENFKRSAHGAIPSMLISTRMLERQIDWLAQRFSLLTLDEIGARLESGAPFEKPAAAVTFDDGYSDAYHLAYPLLKRKGVPAAFFVVTGLVDTGHPQIFDRLYLLLRLIHTNGLSLSQTLSRAFQSLGANTTKLRSISDADDPFAVMTAVLKGFPRRQVEQALAALEEQFSCRRDLLREMAPATWDMLKTMHDEGMIIGSHTKSHLLLTSESLDVALAELVESKQILEARLNGSIKHFAYPDGRFNSALVQAVGRAGYRFGYGICSSRDRSRPLLTVPRKVLWERSCLNAFGGFSSAVMNCQTLGAFDLRSRCEHDHSTIHGEEKNGTIVAA